VPIDEADILVERYKIAIALFCNHDSILWRQSNIFLLAQIAIMGFALSVPMGMVVSFLFAVGGIVLALTWRFINLRRHHFMKTLIQKKKQAADDLDKCLRTRNPSIQFSSIDVDGEVYEARLKPGLRFLVVRGMPLITLIVWIIWIGYLLASSLLAF